MHVYLEGESIRLDGAKTAQLFYRVAVARGEFLTVNQKQDGEARIVRYAKYGTAVPT